MGMTFRKIVTMRIKVVLLPHPCRPLTCHTVLQANFESDTYAVDYQLLRTWEKLLHADWYSHIVRFKDKLDTYKKKSLEEKAELDNRQCFAGLQISFTTSHTDMRPRLLICGAEGSGQAHLAPALLYALEGLPVHAIGLPSLLSDASAR